MDERHSERVRIDERRRRGEALRAPERFYPRPEDVLADDSLSRDERLELLRNWQVALRDRGGALEQAGPMRDGDEPEDQEIAEALREARRRARGQPG